MGGDHRFRLAGFYKFALTPGLFAAA